MRKVAILSIAFVLALSFSPAFGVQLLLNPSFEDPPGGAPQQPSAWVCLPGGCGETLLTNDPFGGIDPPANTYPDGIQVVRMYVTAWGSISSPHGYYQQVPVVNGGTYTLSGKLWTGAHSGSVLPTDPQGRIGVDQGTSTDVAQVDIWCASGTSTNPNGWFSSQQAWTTLSTTFQATASTITIYLDSHNVGTSGWTGVHFDLVQLDGPDPNAATPTPSPTITPVALAAFNGDFSQGIQGGGETQFAQGWRLWYILADAPTSATDFGTPLTGLDPFPGGGTTSQRFRMIDFGLRAGKHMDVGLSAYIQLTPGVDYNLSAEFVKSGTTVLDPAAIEVNLGVDLNSVLPQAGGIANPASFPNVDWVSEETLAAHTPGLDLLCLGGAQPLDTPFTIARTSPFTPTSNTISVHVEVQTSGDLNDRVGYVDNVSISASVTDVMRERWSLYR